MPIFNNALAGAAGSGGAAGYEIERSLRINRADSAHLTRTPSSAGNRKTWTWSGWVKRSYISTAFDPCAIFAAGGSSPWGQISFTTDGNKNHLDVSFTAGVSSGTRTTAQFRDTSAWYHIVVAVDTTQATASDRIKMYVNGVHLTDIGSSNYPAQNFETQLNSTSVHRIGANGASSAAEFLGGYLADVHFIDGQALAATDFGEYDDNNVWQPIEYTGSHGPAIDQTQTWSSALSDSTGFDSGYPATNAFDGITTAAQTARASTTNTTTTFQPATDIAYTSKVEVWTYFSGSVSLNGGSAVTVSNDQDWRTIATGSGTLDTLTFTGSSSTVYLGAIRIDGVLLVDPGVTVSHNGFHLDFSDNSSNAALGYDRSSYNKLPGALTTTTGGGNFYSGPASRAFDGSTSSDVKGGWLAAGDTSNLIWAPPTGSYSVSSSLRVYAGYYSTIYVNGVSKATGGSTNAASWITLNHTGAINEIKFENTTNDFVVRISAIEIDGTVLVSNGWTVNNLSTAGSNWNQSKIWSNESITSTGSIWSSPPDSTSLVAANMFDGSLSNYVGPYNGGTLTVPFGQTFSGTKTFRVYWLPWISGETIEDQSGNTLYTASGVGSANWVSFSGTDVSALKFTALSSANSSNVYAIEVDGNILVDSGVPDPLAANIDSLIDTPTNYEADTGNNGGNYATLNPLSTRGPTFTEGNLTVENSGSGSSGWRNIASTMAVSSGKWYAEFDTVGSQNGGLFIGIQKVPEDNDQFNPQIFDNNFPGKTANSYALNCFSGAKRTNNSDSGYGSGMSVNDKIMMAVDLDNGKIWWGKNGTWFASGDPDSGTNAAFTGLSGTFVFAVGISASEKIHSNFGQRAYAYSNNISGFKSVCTQNLDPPTIADGSTAMDTTLYTGTKPTSQTISGINHSPDFVWIKNRSTAYNALLFDVVRGAQDVLFGGTDNAGTTDANTLTAFTSDGFTLGGDDVSTNNTNDSLVAWTWDAGSSTVSNTDGSITSSVRASASNGFSVVRWPGTSANATVGHGLNAAPEFIITKVRGMTSNWYCYHTGLTDATKYIWLNSNAAEGTQTAAWNSTAPTSSVIHVGGEAEVNRNGYNTIAYCFAPVEGYSAFGSYTGNGNADGPFVYTGFRPRWALLKESSSAGELWVIYDSERNTSNVMGKQLYPSSNAAEADASADTHARIDFLSNGFKIRGSHSSTNTSGETIVYAAFAEHPFKTARAR